MALTSACFWPVGVNRLERILWAQKVALTGAPKKAEGALTFLMFLSFLAQM